MSIKEDLSKIRDINIRNVMSIGPMLVGYLCSIQQKKKYKNTWMISDRPDEARDNGYHFFKYVNIYHSEQQCIFVLKKSSPDYEKIKAIGNVIEYGSIKHWILYFSCKYNISSQLGAPDSYLCTFLERVFKPKSKYIFLQHGVITSDIPSLHADKRNCLRFVTSATQECDYVKQTYGYPDGVVVRTGLARFDNLHNSNLNGKTVIVMPTWRTWLSKKSVHDESKEKFIDTEYYQRWNEFLNNERLGKIIDKHSLKVVFYLHSNLKNYTNLFHSSIPGVEIDSWGEHDIQSILKEGSILITDYSSVFFDMIYMLKAVIFYQFDLEEYRKYHYQEGWLDFLDNNFCNSYSTSNQVVNELDRLAADNFEVSDKFKLDHHKAFPNFDTNNCKRIFEEIIKIGRD